MFQITNQIIYFVKDSVSQPMSDYDILKMYENIMSCKKKLPSPSCSGKKPPTLNIV